MAVSVVAVGPCGCGKTSALAQLCSQLGAFSEESLQVCKDLSQELGCPSCQTSWMLDRWAVERERVMTVQCTVQPFDSGSIKYCAVDTPGHTDYSKNMLSVTALADVALLMVPASVGEFEAEQQSGRVREIALCCFTLGIKHIVGVVTKMDDESVEYSQSRYEEIKKVMNAHLKEVGYKQKDVPFVPASGLRGENFVSKSANMAWYDGSMVVEALDALGPMNRPAEKPLRLPVLRVHDIQGVGTVIVGRVETGSVRTGIKLLFSPTGQVGEVSSIEVLGEQVNEAKSGDIVGICISGGLDIRRGMVASFSTNDPVSDAECFIAQVVVLDHPSEIRAGYCPSIVVHTSQVPCEFEELIAKIDRKTGKEVETKPERVVTGDVVTVRLRPRNKVCVEVFSAYPSLGRFAVRDHNRTLAVGVIKEVTKRSVVKRTGNDNQYFDERD